jgi:hypothetical protein
MNINIQILSKPDVIAEGTLNLKSCELKIETQMDAVKFKAFSDAFLEDGKFKSNITSSCNPDNYSLNFGAINSQIIKEKGFLMKRISVPKKPSLEDLDGGRKKSRRVRKSRKTRKVKKARKSRK